MDDNTNNTVWPDVPRAAFTSGHGVRSVCVDYVQGRRSFYAYAEGYRRAAIAAYESAVVNHDSPDYMLWPIAYLWRHFLELSLKNVIALGEQIAGGPPVEPTGHQLGDLWRRARPHIAPLGAEDSPELDNVEQNIVEFSRIDPRADGFRYPTSIHGGRSMPNAPSHVGLDELHEAMLALGNFFDAVRTAMEVYLDDLLTEMFRLESC